MFKEFGEFVAKVINKKPARNYRKPMKVTDAKFIVQGVANDQEKILQLRPWIEDEAREQYGDFSRTELVWNMDHATGNFDYDIYFYA